MEYKTKTSKRVQKESKIAEVNKKRGNDTKRSDKEKKEEADEFSNNFPNFRVLNEEEKLAFFEALSTARKNIEKKGLPIRERFGTVHDKYLEYLTNDEKEKETQRKPESASSTRPNFNPTTGRKNIQKPSESSARKVSSSKPTSPLAKKVHESPQTRSVRPESESNEKFDSIIKGETDKVIQMYLNKKRRIEDKNMSPPFRKLPQPKTNIQKNTLKPSDKESVQLTKKTQKGTNEPKAKSSFRVKENPRFQSLDFTERQEFFRIMREAHDKILQNDPHKEILSYDEILTPYESECKETIIVNPVRELPMSRRKNLRVKVTVTSGDNERLNRSKSQILLDCAKEEVSERSRSLESIHNRDMFRGKQSKIPVLKKTQHDNADFLDVTTIKNKPCENKNDTAAVTEDNENQKTTTNETCEKQTNDGTMRKIAKEKAKTLMTDKNVKESNIELKKKIQESNRARNAGLVKLKAINLEKKKAEFRRALKEKENKAAEAARREKELQKKKRVEERKKRHQMISDLTNTLSAKKSGNKLTDYCPAKKTKKKCPKEEIPIEIEEKKECVKEVEEKVKENEQTECLEEKEDSCSDLQEEEKEGEEECLEEETSSTKLLNINQKKEVEEVFLEKETSSANVFLLDKKKEAEEECLEKKTHSFKDLPRDAKKSKEKCKEKSELEMTKKGESDFLQKKSEETKEEEVECERRKSATKAQEVECERRKSATKAREEVECERRKSATKAQEVECERRKSATKAREVVECERKKSTAKAKEEDECGRRKSATKAREEIECERRKSATRAREEIECERRKSATRAREEIECERRKSATKAEDIEKTFLVSSAEQKLEGSIIAIGQNNTGEQKSTESEEDSSEESQTSFVCTCTAPQSQSFVEDVSFEDATCVNVALSQQKDLTTYPCNEKNEQLVERETHSRKNIGKMSFLEQRPEEIKGESKRTLSCNSIKMTLVNEKALEKIRNLIAYLENKVKESRNFEKHYVSLVLSYTDYLAKAMETLIEDKKLNQRVHSTYTAHEIRLKFQDKSKEELEELKKIPIQRSISDTFLLSNKELKLSREKKKLPGPQEKLHWEESGLDLPIMEDSDSSSESENEGQMFIPSSFKRISIPKTKIRVLQDLLKGRAGFVEGSVEDFQIVHYPEPEFVPKDEPQTTKELTELDEDQGEKVIRMKFLKNLANLCRCGKKQVEEEAILENLKGEAVRVDTSDRKKDQASVTINQSTMEVLKAAERKKIIQKYFKVH